MNKEEIKSEVEAMLTTLEAKIPDNPHLLSEEISTRCAMLARSAVLYAEAQRIYSEAYGMKLTQCLKLSPSIAKEIAKSYATEEQYVFTLADRLNSALVHSMDSLRSVLSYEKSQINNIPYQK